MPRGSAPIYPAAFVLAYLLAQIPQSAGALMRAVEHHFGGTAPPSGALWVRFRGVAPILLLLDNLADAPSQRLMPLFDSGRASECPFHARS